MPDETALSTKYFRPASLDRSSRLFQAARNASDRLDSSSPRYTVINSKPDAMNIRPAVQNRIRPQNSAAFSPTRSTRLSEESRTRPAASKKITLKKTEKLSTSTVP